MNISFCRISMYYSTISCCCPALRHSVVVTRQARGLHSFSLQGRKEEGKIAFYCFFQQSTFSSLSQQETPQTASSDGRNENDVGRPCPLRGRERERERETRSAFRESNSKVIRDLWNSAKVGFGKSQRRQRPSLHRQSCRLSLRPSTLATFKIDGRGRRMIVNRKRNILATISIFIVS